MRLRQFKQVDVFTGTAYRGNALAVVLDATGLSDEQMQRFASWTQLSETTFLLPARASGDYQVRIFTPGGELPFAGHPTLGSCHAWLEAAGNPRDREFIVQECQVGAIKVRRDGARLAFAAPSMKRSVASPDVLARITQALGLRAGQVIASQLLDNGPLWLGLLVDTPQTVLALSPDHAQLRQLGLKVGIAALYPNPPAAGPHLEVRGFAAPIGVTEDPVTGSLNASLGQWLIGEGVMAQRYVAAQGACLGRAGRVYLERDSAGQVWVGGESITCISGTVLV